LPPPEATAVATGGSFTAGVGCGGVPPEGRGGFQAAARGGARSRQLASIVHGCVYE
jgi:hypothetical protein